MAITPDPDNVKPWTGPHRLPRIFWGWPIAFGVILLILGALALHYAVYATLANVYILGIFLLVGGVTELLGGVWARPWQSAVLHTLAGVLYLVVGVLVVGHPFQAVAGVTLILAVFLLTGGLARVVVAVSEQVPNWGWVVLNGLITMLLGVFIWKGWPWDSIWVIGVFIGVELLFGGIWWIMLGVTIAGISRRVSTPGA